MKRIFKVNLRELNESLKEDKLVQFPHPRYSKDIYCEARQWNLKIPETSDQFKKLFIKSAKRYYRFLNRLELVVQQEKTYRNELQLKVNKETDRMLFVASLLESFVRPRNQLAIRNCFRLLIGEFLFSSKLFDRFYRKPNGYPGDYLMFEMMYNQKRISSGLGCYFDGYVFSHDLVKAVINRKNTMLKIIKEHVKDCRKGSHANILNIACGSSKEIQDLLEARVLQKGINFYLLDQDPEALRFSQEKLANISASECSFNFIKENILNLLQTERLEKVKKIKGVKFSLIYSLGLLDYFRDFAFKQFVRTAYTALQKKGVLIIAICSSHDPKLYRALKWLCEWNFFARDAMHTKKLVRHWVKSSSVDVAWEENSKIFFIKIKRNR